MRRKSSLEVSAVLVAALACGCIRWLLAWVAAIQINICLCYFMAA